LALPRLPDTSHESLLWEYAASKESTDIVSLDDRYGLFIDGELRAPKSRKHFPTINPATEEELATVAEAGKADVDDAVAAARSAYQNVWGPMAPAERAKYIFRIARMIQERSRELAVLETLDGGKPIKESRDVDLPLVAGHFFYYAGWADKLEYAFPGITPRPLGVAGQVIPWNFPLLMLAWKVAPALAAGNTVVLKPAETTPLTALVFAELTAEAGLPPGVFNVVTGAGNTGSLVVTHDDVDKVAFTGSTAVGKLIQSELAGTSKKLTLELGGKGAQIVFEDAPLDQAVEGVINGIFFNQGHVCCAGSRLFVEESIHDRFIDKLKRRLNTLRVGDPMDKNTDIGAINSRAQLDKIEELVDSGRSEGAEMFQPDCELPTNGFFFRPTLFTGVSQSHRIAQEEIFGPVLSILSFRTPEEAVEKANNTPYGLSAGIWTTKGSRILWMADRLKAGVIWANTFNKFDPASPFGGYKESGFGREGGRHGLLAYMDWSEG
jgi:aldehyde dehydrogenase (NAD+)